MAAPKSCLHDEGFKDAATFVRSGDVLLRSDLDAGAVAEQIEPLLPTRLSLDSSLARVVAIERSAHRDIVAKSPVGFGDGPATYLYNVVFLMGVSATEAIKHITAREG